MSIDPKGRGTGVLGAGMTLTVTVLIFSYGGDQLDRWLSTRPLFLVLGVLLGSVGGFIHLLRVAAPQTLPFGKSKKGLKEARSGDSVEDEPSKPDRSDLRESEDDDS